MYLTIVIIIMEICKAPTQRPKALNKHTHIMYIEMENVIQKTHTQKHQTFNVLSVSMHRSSACMFALLLVLDLYLINNIFVN